MDWFTGIIVFLLVWWVVIFTVLPFGNKASGQTEDGMAGSAPDNPRIKLKFLITTGISVLIWLIIYALIENEIINYHEYARGFGTREFQE